MGAAGTFNEVILNCINSSNDYPRGYQVYVSDDGVNWGSSIATGTGTPSITTITFAPQAARYIRIIQTGSAPGNFWSIDEFNVIGTSPTAPAGLMAVAISSSEVDLSWNAGVSATGYNVKRSTASNGTYVAIATNLPYLNYSDTGLAAGTTYYYVVTATNSFGESAASAVVSAQPVSLTPPQLNFGIGSNQIQILWPMDHLGWELQMQTNSPGSGLGTNWVTVPGSGIRPINSPHRSTTPMAASFSGWFIRKETRKMPDRALTSQARCWHETPRCRDRPPAQAYHPHEPAAHYDFQLANYF